MTIGIGGWGSRRKPMSIVRAILRSDLRDLTIVSYGGPDVGMLCAAGKVRKAVYGFVSLDSIPLEPHFRAARQNATIEAMELDEGMLQLGPAGRGDAGVVPPVPGRPGLGDHGEQPRPEDGHVARTTARSCVAMPALPLDVALLHANRADARGDAQYLGNDWYFDDLFAMAAKRTFVSCERIVEPSGFLDEGRRRRSGSAASSPTAWSRRPTARTSRTAFPTTSATRPSSASTRRRPRSPSAWAAFRAKYVDIPEADYRRVIGVAS